MKIDNLNKTSENLIDTILKEYEIEIDQNKFMAEKNLSKALAQNFDLIKNSKRIIRTVFLPDMIYDLREIIEEDAHDKSFTYQYQDSSAYISELNEEAINSYMTDLSHLAENGCNLLFLQDGSDFYFIEGYEENGHFHTFDELDKKLSSIEIGITTHETKHELINEAYVYDDPASCYPAEYDEKEITDHTYISLEDIGISVRDTFISNYNEITKIIEEAENTMEREE